MTLPHDLQASVLPKNHLIFTVRCFSDPESLSDTKLNLISRHFLTASKKSQSRYKSSAAKWSTGGYECHLLNCSRYRNI